MTQVLMNDWCENYFIPNIRIRNIRIRLVYLMTQKLSYLSCCCSAHTLLKVLVKDNVSVLLFPPNCTSIIQPMDIEIMRALKCKYKVAFLISMLNFLNNGKTIHEFLKYFSIKSALRSITRS
ncbi:hypothetical protein X975_22260, partial [Stegodyphus mimosarum]